MGSRKGAYCPKWEVETSRCSIAGVRAHSGARGGMAPVRGSSLSRAEALGGAGILGSMFPFWNPTGVFPRSVTPTRRKGHPLVVSCFLSIQVLRASTRVRRPPGPTWPGSTRAEAAQDGSEDVTVRSVSVRMRCLTDGLSSDNAVDFMHAFATASRELRLA